MTALPTIASIQRTVADLHNIGPEMMREPDGNGARRKEYVRPRQEAMALALLLTGKESTTIGRHFHRDHSTVLSSFRVVTERRRSDPELDERLKRLSLELIRGSAVGAGV